jgi:hypothetical protein
VGFVKNEAAMPQIKTLWDRCCEFHFNPTNSQNGTDYQRTLAAKEEFYSTGERAHTWFSSKDKQNDFWAIFDKSLDAYIETTICPTLNTYFSRNIEFQAALPTAQQTPVAIAEKVVEAAPSIVEQVYSNPVQITQDNFINLDDSGNDLPF